VLTCAPDLDAALASADVTVLLQPHAQYDLDAIGSSGAKILDTRGAVEPDATIQRL
jgi:UDP-N-acetyl-D-mannosaminuronate dehydrogenase